MLFYILENDFVVKQPDVGKDDVHITFFGRVLVLTSMRLVLEVVARLFWLIRALEFRFGVDR